jgi:hypothetical protein
LTPINLNYSLLVIARLVPAIPISVAQPRFANRDGRDKPGHDELKVFASK